MVQIARGAAIFVAYITLPQLPAHVADDADRTQHSEWQRGKPGIHPSRSCKRLATMLPTIAIMRPIRLQANKRLIINRRWMVDQWCPDIASAFRWIVSDKDAYH